MPPGAPPSFISTPEEIRALRNRLSKRGKRLVFTNGCFDLLHAGHVRYLNEARALGDALVVAVNSDASVRELKGPSRPINTEEDRAEILCGLRAVDAVCVFNEPRVTGLIEAIRPHLYAKGGDYTLETLNAEERAALEAVKAGIHLLPLVPGRSTTNTLKRMASSSDTASEAAGTAPSRALRIAVLGSGEGSNFKAITDAIASGALKAEIVCVISDRRDSGILKQALALKLDSRFVDPGLNPTRFVESAQKEVLEHLQRTAPDVVVLAGFMRLLREPTLGAFQGRIINLHPSLLPKFKGSNAVQRAIDDGELHTGTSIHLVTEELDGGKVLAQARVPIHIGDTTPVVTARIKAAEHELLPKVLAGWRIGSHSTTCHQ